MPAHPSCMPARVEPTDPFWQIRPAVPEDLDRLVELHQALQDHLEACNLSVWRMAADARAKLRAQLAGRLRCAGSCTLVAEHARGGAVGVVSGRVVTNLQYVPARTGAIDQLYVLEGYRRQGVGSLLVVGLCRWFAGQGVSDLSLRYVYGNQAAEAFWLALGFAPRIVTTGAALPDVELRLAAIGRS